MATLRTTFRGAFATEGYGFSQHMALVDWGWVGRREMEFG